MEDKDPGPEKGPEKKKDPVKERVHKIIQRLRGLLTTGTDPNHVQGVIDELVAEHGEPKPVEEQ